MSYRIEKGEGLAVALERIAAEEMDLALTELHRGNRGRAIHDARKSIKRLRALLRSLRVAFPKELYRLENQRLAEAGRKISPLRDVHVQLQTLGKLKAGGKIERDLLIRQERFARKIPALKETVRRMLDVSRGTIKSWPLDKTTPATLAAGLKRLYKQGRSAFKTTRKNPTPENLHEWRKKVKALGYGLELVETLVARKFLKRLRQCQELGESLGDDHDLFLVLQALGRANQSQPSRNYARLKRRIAAKRAKLQKRAFQIGKKVYQEKPRAFAKSLDQHPKRSGEQK